MRSYDKDFKMNAINLYGSSGRSSIPLRENWVFLLLLLANGWKIIGRENMTVFLGKVRSKVQKKSWELYGKNSCIYVRSRWVQRSLGEWYHLHSYPKGLDLFCHDPGVFSKDCRRGYW